MSDKEKNIYWWSSRKAVHSKNVLRDGRVFITILDKKATQKDGRAVYIQGRAKVLEDEAAITKASELYNRRSTFVKLTKDITSGKAPTRIFKATPENVWLNAEGKEGEYYIDVRKKIS